jgi:murein DD-endopeptidase MepM/ murein hydrolase activator NlpD
MVGSLPGMSISLVSPLLTVLLVIATPPGEAERTPGMGGSTAPGLVTSTAAAVASPRWRAPLDVTRGAPLVVRRGFAAPAQRWSPGHRGVDLAASAGTPVRAAGAGVVVFAGTLAGRGVVSVEHAPGVRTTYEPVAPAVRAGDRVSAGALLGRVDPDSRHRDCLHWGLRVRGDYVDPLRLLRRTPVLKPTGRHATPVSLTPWGAPDR